MSKQKSKARKKASGKKAAGATVKTPPKPTVTIEGNVYTGEHPWAGGGSRIEKDPSLDDWDNLDEDDDEL